MQTIVNIIKFFSNWMVEKWHWVVLKWLRIGTLKKTKKGKLSEKKAPMNKTGKIWQNITNQLENEW